MVYCALCVHLLLSSDYHISEIASLNFYAGILSFCYINDNNTSNNGNDSAITIVILL